MNAIELIIKDLTGGIMLVTSMVGDFTDAELLTRSAPTSNHPLYQLGHICSAEVHLMNYCKPGIHKNIPPEFLKRFDKKCCGENDPAKLATKKELLELFTTIRGQTIDYAKSLSEADLDKPTNVPFAPTVGQMLTLQVSHAAMHIGQIQVARRTLGKPILF